MKILVLGGTGMAGHMISIYLYENGHNVTMSVRTINNLFSKNIKQILWNDLDFNSLKKIIKNNNYDVVINCIGILNDDVDANLKESILLNSYLPQFLNYTCSQLKIKFIHISTDCVFSGKQGNYSENSISDGLSNYDKTKSLGEFNSSNNLVLRNSIIGPDIDKNGKGLFNWIFYQKNKSINGYKNWIWSGITTLELAKQIKIIIEKKWFNGIKNLTNEIKISKYELLSIINSEFNLNVDIRPLNHDIFLDKSLITIREKWIFIPSYETMIRELKEWILNHKDIYSSNYIDFFS